jgi:hypothetical protein
MKMNAGGQTIPMTIGIKNEDNMKEILKPEIIVHGS